MLFHFNGGLKMILLLCLHDSLNRKVVQTLAKRVYFPAQDRKVRLNSRCDWKDSENFTEELHEIR